MLPDFLDTAPPLTDEQLDEFFGWEADGGPGQDQSPDRPAAARWQVNDRQGAEWAMRKLATAQGEAQGNEMLAQHWKAQVDAWLTQANADAERRIRFFDGALCDYLRRLREEDPKHKSERLPSGDIVSRTVPARPAVTDDERFLLWAKDHLAAAVRVKESPALDEIKRRISFRTVLVPRFVCDRSEVFEVDGFFIAVPEGLTDDVARESWLSTIKLEGDGFFHEETWAIFLTSDRRFLVVPGVVQVPETVSITVKPSLPNG